MARRRISSSAMVPYGSSMWMSHGGSAMITLASARGWEGEVQGGRSGQCVRACGYLNLPSTVRSMCRTSHWIHCREMPTATHGWQGGVGG